MLITLGPWVEEPETWDESLWGGSGTARRRGRGYYEGMTDQDLLDASRLFWRFRPDSERWKGIRYALVAHAGTVRAVVRITKMIGPLWGRHGFQGHVLKDSEFALELIGRTVPARQNPATTIELLAAGPPLAGRPGPGGPIRGRTCRQVLPDPGSSAPCAGHSATGCLFVNERFLRQVLAEDLMHYNTAGRTAPSVSSRQLKPTANLPDPVNLAEHRIRRKQILGGLTNEYHLAD
jgi:hypothetical protein